MYSYLSLLCYENTTFFRRGSNVTIISYIKLRLDIGLNITMSLLLYRYYHIASITLLLIYDITLYYDIGYGYSSLACFDGGFYYYLEAFFLYI